MSLPPALFDASAVRRVRRRAARSGVTPFLLHHAAGEIRLRLSAIMRRFDVALLIGCDTAARDQLHGIATTIIELTHAPADGFALVGDAERLPIAAGSIDLIVSLLDLQSANDLPGALVQARRALRPDGLFVAVLLGGASLAELRTAFAEAESALLGGVSPHVAPMADVRDCGALLQRAGLALPVSDTDTLTVRYADPRALMRDLRGMGLTNVLAGRRRTFLRRAVLREVEAIYAGRYGTTDGRVIATFELITMTGWAPGPGQQQPARRGSATVALAAGLAAARDATED